MGGCRRSSSARSHSGGKKRVVWDERNLNENAEYHRLHPVTMHIDEPKTPYHYMDDAPLENDEEEMWDPQINAYVREVKDRITGERTGPVAPFNAKTGCPQLAPGTINGELSAEKAKTDFVKVRKAVYADEGAKFREMLKRKENDEDDE